MKTILPHSQPLLKFWIPGALFSLFAMSLGAHIQAAPKSAAASRSSKSKSTVPHLSRALRLRRHAFPDVTMGIPAAYTVMLPVGWSASGKIEWQPVGEVPFPQQKIEINSPRKGRISFEPLMTFSYMEGPGMPTQGIPAPRNLPQWLIGAVAQTNPKIRNVQLIKSSRDTKAEAFMKNLEVSTGGAGGMEREVHVIVLEYDEANLRRREEVSVTYVRFPPYLSANMNSQLWSLAPSGAFSAPASQFAAQRPMLVSVANTVRATPQWHIQSQAVIAEMSRRRVANNWELIKQRGRNLSQLSDADYAKYKRDTSGGDAAQRTRINTINETDDFKDTNGNIVNLPMHYHHVFSDGKGNYVLSNNSHDKPGELWKPIRPIK